MPKVYDLNRMRKTYPLIRKKPRYATLETTQTESAIIDISDGLPKTYTFENSYDEVPVCIASSEQSNVNVFISSITLTHVVIEVSEDPPGVCLVHLLVVKES